MNAEREFELKLEAREPSLPDYSYYICPNQFDFDTTPEGADVLFRDEDEARDAAFKIARFICAPVTIDVKCDGRYEDTIIIKPEVKVA